MFIYKDIGDDFSLIIKGLAFPIGKLNANGWGIPASEIDNAISSLKESVIRVCPARNDQHACDITESSWDEIGTVLDAFFDPITYSVYYIAEISDRNAIQKLEDSVWPFKTSVYGQGQQDSDGFVHNYINKSVTLVTNPAWNESEFAVIASNSSSDFSDEKTRFKTVNDFVIISAADFASQKFSERKLEMMGNSAGINSTGITADPDASGDKMSMNIASTSVASQHYGTWDANRFPLENGGNTMTEEEIKTLKASVEEHVTVIANQKTEIDTLKASLDTVKKDYETLKATDGEKAAVVASYEAEKTKMVAETNRLMASLLEKETELTTLKASFDEQKKTMIRSEDVEAIVAAKLTAEKEVASRENAIEKFKSVAASLQIDYDEARFAGKTSVDILADVEMFSKLVASPVYGKPAGQHKDNEYELSIGYPSENGWKVK